MPGIHMGQWLNSLLLALLDLLPRLVVVFLLLLLARALARWTARTAGGLLERTPLEAGLRSLLIRVAYVGVVVLGLLVALFVLGLHGIAFSFVAGLAIPGLVIAFAVQDITKNLASGLLLLLERPFQVGDRINVGDNEGVITDIALRATSLRTDDNRQILVPNAQVYTSVIVNLTRYPIRRYSQQLKLTTETPLVEALAAIESLAQSIDGVHKTPPPRALVTDPVALTIEVQYWLAVNNVDVATVNSRMVHGLRVLIAERGWI